MDARQLRSFLILAEELHFVRAAARLGISQPALSQQIRRLERTLGVALFNRSQRRVTLTDAGRAFSSEAASALRQIEFATITAQRAAHGHIGRLKIGFVEAAILNILPPIISRYRDCYPNVQIEIRGLVSEDAENLILNGELDAAIVRPVGFESPIDSIFLYSENYVVAVPNGHKFIKLDSVPLEDVLNESWVTHMGAKSRYLLGSVFYNYFKERQKVPSIIQEVDRFYAIISLVAAGIGIAVVPQSLVALKLDGMEYKPISGPKLPVAELVLAWRSGNNNSSLKNFRAKARELQSQ